MTLTSILIFFCSLTLYWLMKVTNAKQKHKDNFRAGIFLSDNKWQIIITILWGITAYFSLPALLPQANDYSIAAIAGYANSSILKFIVDSLKLAFTQPKKTNSL